jgi:hypothetical protein
MGELHPHPQKILQSDGGGPRAEGEIKSSVSSSLMMETGPSPLSWVRTHG